MIRYNNFLKAANNIFAENTFKLTISEYNKIHLHHFKLRSKNFYVQ